TWARRAATPYRRGTPPRTFGAGNGIRTRDPQLGRLMLYQLSYSRPSFSSPAFDRTAPRWWRGKDSNLRRHTPADLQSAPFGHSGTSPARQTVSAASLILPPR